MAETIADDPAYHVVEEMGLGLTFRSCTCGQLPCARLRPLRDALEATAYAARSALAHKVLEITRAEQDDSERRGPQGYDDDFDRGRYSASTTIAAALRELFQKEGIDLESE